MGSGVARRDWRAGGPAGLCGAGRAHTWALFLQRAARDSAPRRLIKLRGAGLMRSTCVGPARPRPRPRPLRSFLPSIPALHRPPLAWGSEAELVLRLQPMQATAIPPGARGFRPEHNPSPCDPGQVTLPQASVSLQIYKPL